jgi:hypothetical protein
LNLARRRDHGFEVAALDGFRVDRHPIGSLEPEVRNRNSGENQHDPDADQNLFLARHAPPPSRLITTATQSAMTAYTARSVITIGCERRL